MSRAISFEISIDDIEKQLEKYSWIDSYEIFTQSLFKLTSISQLRKNGLPQTKFQKRKTSGFAIRYITTTHHLVELSLGISLIKKLAELQPPKSTQLTNTKALFNELKKPKLTSIAGDDFKSTNISTELSLNTIDNLASLLHDDVLEGSTITFEIEKEIVQLVNSHSKPQQINSLHTSLGYQYTFENHQKYLTAENTEFRRNLHFNNHEIIQNVSNSISNRLIKSVDIDPKDAKIVLHPEVLGRIIAYQSSLFLSDSPIEQNIIWSDNFFLYDDPLRDHGYYSVFMDDEGTETKSKTLIERGVHKRGLNTLLNTKWKEGGNAFRNMWFHPVKHSFEYAIRKDATNLVLSGGTGKGEKFTNSQGLSLLIKNGHGYIGGLASNPFFVIHSSETEVWRNGEFLGPTKNYTISGSLHDVMTYGDLSADEYQVIDRAIPTAIYIGWLRLPSDLITFG